MEVCTVGGFEEVGKNMTAVKVGEDVFLFDCGFFLPGIIELQEEPFQKYTERSLRRVGGIPDDRVLDKLGWTSKVKAVFISHAHLDHVGGMPYLAHRYPDATIFGSQFTISVLESLMEDEGIVISNPIKKIEFKKKYPINGAKEDCQVEFVYTTHSTLDSGFVVLHTSEGRVLYALDYKFDDKPTFDGLTDYESLERVGKEGVKLAIINTLYSSKDESNGTETDADKMLEEAFRKIENKKSAFFITTFSSHIERLTNIIKHAKQTNREIIVVGRSLAKYIHCAEKIKKWKFEGQFQVIKYRRQINSFFKKLERERERYLVICTGHQGEKNSILDRISKGETNFQFKSGDNLIFSSSVIPTEVNIEARKQLDLKLKKLGVILQKDVHVHGHGSKASKKKLIELTKPKHIIPAHGSPEQEEHLIELAKEYGYEYGKTSHMAKNGEVFNF